jgi:hypothetical protein
MSNSFITGQVYGGMTVTGQGQAHSPKGKFPDWIVWTSETSCGSCSTAEFEKLVAKHTVSEAPAPPEPKEEPQEAKVVEPEPVPEPEPEPQPPIEEEDPMTQQERDKRFAKTLIEFSLPKLEQFVEEGGVDHLLDLLMECENEREGGPRKGGLKLLNARKKSVADEK